jgi:DNA-binding MarR family transcriptional regulator
MWTFLSNHAHVLICLGRDPEQRLRDVSVEVGITERAVQKIVNELVEAGALDKIRDGRRNHYVVHLDLPLRHRLEAHCSTGSLLSAVLGAPKVRALRKRQQD